MKYIDADKLIAEIERLKKHRRLREEYGYGWKNALNAISTFLDTLPELPEGLEEAAVAYSKQVSDGHNYRDLTCGFIAGAEWRYQKDRGEFAKLKAKEWSDGYNEGIEKGKDKMLEDAVEHYVVGEIAGSPVGPAIVHYDENLNIGDKVKIIIVKED